MVVRLIMGHIEKHLAASGSETPGVSTAIHKKNFKFHDDQNETVEAALDKAKKVSGTQHDSVAFEHICLDYLGGHTMAQQLKTVGPESSAKAVKSAFSDTDVLAKFVKEFGAEALLDGIETAEPTWTITIERPDDEPPEIDDSAD